MTAPARFRPRALLEALADGDVDFVLIGGLAVIAWGHERATDDVDLVPDPDPGNMHRLSRVLRDLDGRVVVGDRLLDAASVDTFLRAGDMVFVATSLGRVDVVQGVVHIPRYADLVAASSLVDLAGIEVRVCSLSHLESMKLAGGRHRDLADLEALRSAHPEFDWRHGNDE